jgi:peptide chain release factor 2
MAAREYQLEIDAIDATLVSIEKVLDLPKLRKQAAELEVEAGVPNLWDDPEAAQKITSRLSRVQSEIAKLSGLRQRVEDLPILFELAAGEPGGNEDAEKELDAVKKSVSELEVQTLLNGEYDDRDALITIRSEAGGVEAADWAEMIMRMYLRYCERHSFKVDVLETSYAEEAGIKSTTFKVSAPYAYGTLSVSGPGGQGVNTTDSAVRLTHIPTGIVVSCQNERSQIQNKATAMAVLQSKLLERRRQEEQAKINALKGDNSGSWGNQMRSYVLAPYQMVKDLRTDYETGNTSAVLNGEIDEFIEAGIRWRRSS